VTTAAQTQQSQPSDRKLLLIDVYALVYRAFFALPPLTTSKGIPVSAAYGFERMLNRVLNDERPTHAIACLDAGIPAQRLAAVPEYKAQRPETPDDLKPQFGLVRKILDAYGIPIVEVEGEEADDCIATVASRASRERFCSIVVSGDLDLLQLVDEHCTVVLTRRGISELARYDGAAVRERFGLEPRQLPDYRALKGDPSDNLPGIPGVGDKTAAKLIAQYGSLEHLLQHAADVTPKRIADLLLQYADQARRCRQVSLATRDLPIAIEWETCEFTAPTRERLAALYAQLEFRSLLSKVSAVAPAARPDGGGGAAQEPGPPSAAGRQSVLAAAVTHRLQSLPANPALEVLADPGAALAALARARQSGSLCIACLPEIGSWRSPAPAALAFAWAPDGASVAALELLLDGGQVGQTFAALLGDDGVAKTFHDAKAFAGFAAARSLPLRGVVCDTALAAGLLDASRGGLSLEQLYAELQPQAQIGALEPAQSEGQLFDGRPQVQAAHASAALALFQLAAGLQRALQEAGMLPLLHDIEAPLAPVLARMEMRGFRLDQAELDNIRARLESKIAQTTRTIFALAGEEFNLNSPKALGSILFDKLALPGAVKRKSGYATGAEVLTPLALEHEIAAQVLEYREVAKLKSTYVDALPDYVDASSGRLHTTLRQLGAETGRLSSSNPNLQNIPVRSDIGRDIRRAFLPAQPGNVLLAADYSQIELRLFAHFSQDPNFIAAFREGEDIHAFSARAVFHLPAQEPVSREMRRRAKAVNFGILYGMGAFGLAQSVGFSRAEAKAFMAEYFARFPRVKEYIAAILEQARSNGYVSTLFGRRRYLPELLSHNHAARAAAERMAINAPLQGSAADLIKLAMVRAAERIAQAGLDAHLVLQVHDELIFEVSPADLMRLHAEAKSAMENVAALRVPLVVDFKSGPNWAAAEAME
jgi:DNA polymerase-1